MVQIDGGNGAPKRVLHPSLGVIRDVTRGPRDRVDLQEWQAVRPKSR